MAPKNIRRVVTGLDAQNKSKWISDEQLPGTWGDEVIGFRVTDLWVMATVPGDVRAGTISLPARSHGEGYAALYRTVESPPKSIYKQHPDRIPKGPDGKPMDVYNKQVGMHVTDTVDYAIVLEGETWCYLEHEDEPKHMKAGDVMIQRGTYHAWHNRSEKRCIMAFILLDAAGAWHKPGTTGH